MKEPGIIECGKQSRVVWRENRGKENGRWRVAEKRGTLKAIDSSGNVAEWQNAGAVA